MKSSASLHYKKNKDSIVLQCQEYRDNNRDEIRRHDIKRAGYRALYTTYAHQLTIDEEPILSEDGTSLEVRCKYCGKYFIPTNREVKGRALAIKGVQSGELHLYCSEGCKYSCPIYGRDLYPRDFRPATSREVQPQLRKLVLERDGYICQKCGRTDTLHCHHIDPVKNNPIESADVDNCTTFCINCHKEVHQQDGCKTGQLANC